MGLSNYLPSSRLIQPGVCTSSTRPASPFEGQYIYETDTNRTLVYDGGAWVMTIDADTPPGLELVKVQTIGTTVASVTVSDVFSSTYDNYRIVVNGGSASADSNLQMTFNGGTSAYYGCLVYALTNGTGPFNAADNNAAQFSFMAYCNTTSGIVTTIEVLGPNLAEWTGIQSAYISPGGGGVFNGSRQATTQHTGFTLTPTSGTMTGGTIRVYGYRNTI